MPELGAYQPQGRRPGRAQEATPSTASSARGDRCGRDGACPPRAQRGRPCCGPAGGCGRGSIASSSARTQRAKKRGVVGRRGRACRSRRSREGRSRSSRKPGASAGTVGRNSCSVAPRPPRRTIGSPVAGLEGRYAAAVCLERAELQPAGVMPSGWWRPGSRRRGGGCAAPGGGRRDRACMPPRRSAATRSTSGGRRSAPRAARCRASPPGRGGRPRWASRSQAPWPGTVSLTRARPARHVEGVAGSKPLEEGVECVGGECS